MPMRHRRIPQPPRQDNAVLQMCSVILAARRWQPISMERGPNS
jgi:hypothetical protein